MSIFKKDNNIMNGKGESNENWNESEHPRDNEGKFSTKNGQLFSKQPQEQQYNLDNEKMIRLPKEKMKELVNKILNFKPIQLEINGEIINAEFDKYTAKKNIYTIGNSDINGYNFKIKNIEQLPEYIKGSSYYYSKLETGKDRPQHKGVKEWHYFINQIQTTKGVYDILINVRDKGDRQYLYEITFNKKKT